MTTEEAVRIVNDLRFSSQRRLDAEQVLIDAVPSLLARVEQAEKALREVVRICRNSPTAPNLADTIWFVVQNAQNDIFAARAAVSAAPEEPE